MTLQDVVTFDILSYYDGKIKTWTKSLRPTATEYYEDGDTIPEGKQIGDVKVQGHNGVLTYAEWKKLTDLAGINGLKINLAGTASAVSADSEGNYTIDVTSKADKVSGATNGNFAGLDSNGNLTDSGYKASDFKTKQTAVADSDATKSGETTTFVDSVTQDANGEITVHKKDIPTVSKSTSGEGGNAGLMTAAQAEKLDGIAAGAQVNVLEGVQLNGTDLSVDGNKKVNVTAIQSVTGESEVTPSDYINVAVKATTTNAAVTLESSANVVTKAIAEAAANNNGLATALDVKNYVAGIVASGVNFRGSVNNYSALLAINNPNGGDMYNVKQDETISGTFYPGDMNYIYVAAVAADAEKGIEAQAAFWDPQAPTIKIETATQSQIDSLFA